MVARQESGDGGHQDNEHLHFRRPACPGHRDLENEEGGHVEKVEPVRGVREVADPPDRPLEEAEKETDETEDEEPYRKPEKPCGPETQAEHQGSGRLRAPPDEIESQERRREAEDEAAACAPRAK